MLWPVARRRCVWVLGGFGGLRCFGRILSLSSLLLLTVHRVLHLSLSIYLSLSIFHSFFSPARAHRWTLVSTNTDTKLLWCYNTATLFLRTSVLRLSLSLSFYYSLSFVSSLVSSLSFSLSRSFFFSVALCQGPSATCATGRPLPVNPAGCPTPTYMAAAQLYPSRAPLTRSTHRDPPPAPLPCRHRVSHGDRTKFIPPNDFITLLRTFNSKLLLRPGHQRN